MERNRKSVGLVPDPLYKEKPPGITGQQDWVRILRNEKLFLTLGEAGERNVLDTEVEKNTAWST